MIPDNELPVLLEQLKAEDPGERRSAAEALGSGDERAIYPLIRTLHDDNTGVQDAAMRSLVSIGGEVTAYMALPLLREGPFLRNAGRVILRQIGRPSVSLLHPLFADKDDDMRTFAVDLISDIGWCDFPADIARLLVQDQNQNTRASAARAIGVLGWRDGLPHLVKALKDNEWVVFSVLEALAAMPDEASVEPVLALLSGPSETLRYAAIETLGKIGSPKSSTALVGRLAEANEIEKSFIIKSLVQIGITPSMAEVGDLLLEMFRNGEWEDRVVALTGLADLKDTHAIPVILDIAGSLEPSDPENEDRLHAVKEALLKFGCAPELLKALEKPLPKFRSQVIAIEIIAELQCKGAVPRLIAIMETDLREVRRAAVLALADIRGPEALAELRKRIEDRDGHVRNAAITALGTISDRESFALILDHIPRENYADVLEQAVRSLLLINPQALFARMDSLTPPVRELVARYAGNADILLALTADSEKSVRLAAISSMGRLQDSRIYARLLAALGDPEPETRKTAVIALALQHARPGDLTPGLKDSDMWVRLYTVKALGDTGVAENAAFIIPLLYDKEVPVVLSTIEALLQLGRGDAVALSAIQNHPDESVRDRVNQIMEHAL